MIKTLEAEFIRLTDGNIYIVVPDFGIMKQFEVGGGKVFMVSKASPIGGALNGVQVGGEIEFRGRKLKVMEIL